MTLWQVSVAPVVLSDLRTIEDYYRIEAPDQMRRFRAEFQVTVERIQQWPYLSKEDRPNVRHRTMGVFPYHIFYTLDETTHTVIVAAVLHQRRDPALAQLRLP